MTFLRLTEIASAASAVLTFVVIMLLRFAWRRGKPLQEP